MTCLVADDHPAVVEAVADVLAENGIEIAGRARDGNDAVEQIEKHKPDVAILDLRMPGLSGIEVARHVARTAPDTAVILYTAFGDRALLTEALDAGARATTKGMLVHNLTHRLKWGVSPQICGFHPERGATKRSEP